MYATTETLREQQVENAALLVNLWHGIELDVKTRGACRINKDLIETHYRENDLPADFAFLESEASKLGFSAAQSHDRAAYIFRQMIPIYSEITRKELNNHYRIHGEGAIVGGEILCLICMCRADEHPLLGIIDIETGSRFLRLAGRAMCSLNVLFVKTLEI